ncbi:MAG: bifunctional sugar-1-phosphate nucleotidylyltransferase/acetyltransferase [Candidatus Micrarchaeia archaeon]
MAIKQAVILAAGEGKRLRPLTYTRPKCMINIAGKPILRHVVDSLALAGVKECVIVVKYEKGKIEEYFSRSPPEGVRITFVEQGQKYGTAAGFACAKGHVSGPVFAVAGDIITEASVYQRLSKAFDEESKSPGGAKIVAALKSVENPQEFGIALVSGNYISGFEEKPKAPKSNLVNCSLYVFGEGVLDLASKVKESKRGEYEVTDLLRENRTRACVISEYWLDMGMPWQLFNANEFLLSKMPAKNEGSVENSTVKGKLILGRNSKVINSYIEGTVYVGENSVIGPHAYVRGTTSIGDNCSIGDSTTVKNSIIFDNVNAKHLSYIGDSIIGEDCNFGAATQIANYRFDAGIIRSKVNEVVIDTKRNKLGAIVGDNCKFGILASIMPGKTVGDGCWIGANAMIEEDVPRKTWIRIKQEIESSPVPKSSGNE